MFSGKKDASKLNAPGLTRTELTLFFCLALNEGYTILRLILVLYNRSWVYSTFIWLSSTPYLVLKLGLRVKKCWIKLNRLFLILSCAKWTIHYSFLGCSLSSRKWQFEFLLAIIQWSHRSSTVLSNIPSPHSCAVQNDPGRNRECVIWVCLFTGIFHEAQKLPLLSWTEGWIKTVWWVLTFLSSVLFPSPHDKVELDSWNV